MRYTGPVNTSTTCPCGQRASFEDCCGRLVTGGVLPATAEQLMRSRYTAFATHHIDYLIDTHHPDTRGDVDRDEVRRFSEGSKWLGLQILHTQDGQEGDERGWVEFVARYKEHGQERIHHELSLFLRHQGRWYFHSAHEPKQEPASREQPKIGRNAPCPCGSGKKHKKCCGA